MFSGVFQPHEFVSGIMWPLSLLRFFFIALFRRGEVIFAPAPSNELTTFISPQKALKYLFTYIPVENMAKMCRSIDKLLAESDSLLTFSH